MKDLRAFRVYYSLYRLGADVFPFRRCRPTPHFEAAMRDRNFTRADVEITYENGIWVQMPDGRWHIATMDTVIVVQPMDDDTFLLITIYPISEQRWFRLLDLAAAETWASAAPVTMGESSGISITISISA